MEFETASGLGDLLTMMGMHHSLTAEGCGAPRALPAPQLQPWPTVVGGGGGDHLVPDGGIVETEALLDLEAMPSFDIGGDAGDGLLKVGAKIDPTLDTILQEIAAAASHPAEGGEDVAEESEDAAPSDYEEAASPVASDGGNDEELPYGWDDAMLDMTTRQLNNAIRRQHLSKDQGKAIKATRRRLKNRCYAKTSRKRRLAKVAALADNHQEVSERSRALHAEVAGLRKANAMLQRRLEAFSSMLVASGKMDRATVDAYVAGADTTVAETD